MGLRALTGFVAGQACAGPSISAAGSVLRLKGLGGWVLKQSRDATTQVATRPAWRNWSRFLGLLSYSSEPQWSSHIFLLEVLGTTLEKRVLGCSFAASIIRCMLSVTVWSQLLAALSVRCSAPLVRGVVGGPMSRLLSARHARSWRRSEYAACCASCD